jgi:hypothetical protein
MTYHPTSRLIRPAIVALTALMLMATPVALGTSGLVAHSALAASKDHEATNDSRDKRIHERVDKTSRDSNDTQSIDKPSNDKPSNDKPSNDKPSNDKPSVDLPSVDN